MKMCMKYEPLTVLEMSSKNMSKNEKRHMDTQKNTLNFRENSLKVLKIYLGS